MDNSPHKISKEEWDEIVRTPVVRESWGIGDDTEPLEFASTVYGAKFHFVSAGPGYVGDIFILQGDAIVDVPPMVLRRGTGGVLMAC